MTPVTFALWTLWLGCAARHGGNHELLRRGAEAVPPVPAPQTRTRRKERGSVVVHPTPHAPVVVRVWLPDDGTWQFLAIERTGWWRVEPAPGGGFRPVASRPVDGEDR